MSLLTLEAFFYVKDSNLFSLFFFYLVGTDDGAVAQGTGDSFLGTIVDAPQSKTRRKN